MIKGVEMGTLAIQRKNKKLVTCGGDTIISDGGAYPECLTLWGRCPNCGNETAYHVPTDAMAVVCPGCKTATSLLELRQLRIPSISGEHVRIHDDKEDFSRFF